MATIILFDLSLSMCRSVKLSDTSENYTLQNLANYGLIELLDYMSINNRMEYVSLMYFSLDWDRDVNFTRDYDSIKLALANNFNTFYNSTNIENALKAAQDYIIEEWGQNLDIPIQILLITDGNPGIQAINKIINKTTKFNKQHLIYTNNDNIFNQFDDDELNINDFQRFKFPCKLHVINLCTKFDLNMYDESIEYYKRLIIDTNYNQNLINNNLTAIIDEQLHYLDNYSLQSVSNLFKDLAIKHYTPFNTNLKCGNLISPITIYPPLKNYPKSFNEQDNILIAKPSLSGITIYGFLDLSDISSPPIHSRHIVLPNLMDREQHLQNFHSILTINSTLNCNLNSSVLSDLG